MPVDAKAHNAKACAACRTQFERGEISLADYVWLTGDIERCEFMYPRDGKLRIHICADGLALCGASRKKSFDARAYVIRATRPTGFRGICHECKDFIEGAD